MGQKSVGIHKSTQNEQHFQNFCLERLTGSIPRLLGHFQVVARNRGQSQSRVYSCEKLRAVFKIKKRQAMTQSPKPAFGELQEIEDPGDAPNQEQED